MSETCLHRPQDGSNSGTHHLCVLVHGLWGNASHLRYLSDSLRERHSEDQLLVLVCQRNASSFTYDGIEVGAERVTKEIEETIEELKRDGYKIDRFSIVGYSLGGLIARYAVGLLDSKGYFDYIKPVNFTTFASPHLGVRTPLTGYRNQFWNVFGAHTLSASGRQLFAIDNFRSTGRPLLSILADPDSIFIHALAKFENRCLYTNIVNDRTAVYYTTGISKIDPYANLDKLKLHYVPGYEDVVLDPEEPYELAEPKQLLSLSERIRDTSHAVIRYAPFFAGFTILFPIAIVVFLVNSGVQTLRSQKRILLHEQDNTENGYRRYRIGWMVRDMQAGFEDVFEATNSAQQQQYLPEGSEEVANEDHASPMSVKGVSPESKNLEKSHPPIIRATSTGDRPPEFPTLALTAAQFSMIKALDDVGFRRYGVHIHNSMHSHAALIVRANRKAFDEGKIVVKHWLDHAFTI